MAPITIIVFLKISISLCSSEERKIPEFRTMWKSTEVLTSFVITTNKNNMIMCASLPIPKPFSAFQTGNVAALVTQNKTGWTAKNTGLYNNNATQVIHLPVLSKRKSNTTTPKNRLILLAGVFLVSGRTESFLTLAQSRGTEGCNWRSRS